MKTNSLLKNLLSIFHLILINNIIKSQTYNLVPCPDFECVEYSEDYNTNCPPDPCCDPSLTIKDVPPIPNVYNLHSVTKYIQFYCGPWEANSTGQQNNLDGTPHAPLLLSSTINQVFPANTEIHIVDGRFWDDDQTFCQAYCDAVWKQCPAEFGVPTNTYGIQTSVNTGKPNNNYIALRSSFYGRQGIKVKLLEKLKPCIKYIFECDAVRKTGSETQLKVKFSSDGSWIGENEGENEEGGDFSNIDITNNNEDNASWQHVYIEFEVPEEAEYLHVRIKSPNFLIGTRVVLIDNIKVYRKCDKLRSESSCRMNDNPIGDININESHNAFMPFTVFNLESVDKIELLIQTLVSQDVYKASVRNPPYSVSWNGKNMQGDELPPATYFYRIEYWNGCHPFCWQEGTFVKSGTYSSELNPYITTQGLLTVNNLNNATYLGLRIIQNSLEKRFIKVNNPRNTVAWDGKDESGNFVPDGIYQYAITIANSCDKLIFNGEFAKNSNISVSNYFNYNPLYKNITVGGCGYLLSPASDYYRPPIPCCMHEEDIIIENTTLEGNLTIIARGKIIIGNNVEIAPGSYIIFKAGHGVEGDENLSYDPNVGASYDIEVGIGVCPQRLAEQDYIGDYYENDSKPPSLTDEHGNHLSITPNPSNGVFAVISPNATEYSDVQLFSMDGRLVHTHIQVVGDNKILIDASGCQSGIYLLSIKNNQKASNQRIIINR
jgi:flagellar hook assembly protein FlgD